MARKYISPKNSKAIVSMAQLGWPLWMKLKKLRVEVVGSGLRRFQSLRNERVLICPNHPCESDAEVLFGLSKMVGESFCYLTAHEIFHGWQGFNGHILPRLGCYSVERGVKDIAAFRTTRDLLISNRYKIVGFPEGEISHLNDVVMPLERGLVQMGFSAIESLNNPADRQTVKILPVGLKYFIDEDARAQLRRYLDQIENDLDLCSMNDASTENRVKRAMLSAICRLELQHSLSVSPGQTFGSRLVELRWKLLAKIADRLGLSLSRNDRQVDCAHTIKSIICDLHFHKPPRTVSTLSSNELRQLFREVMLVISLLTMEDSFVGKPYETVSEKNLWDVVSILRLILFRKSSSPPAQLVLVQMGEPINLFDFYPQYKLNRSETLNEVNDLIVAQLSEMLEDLDEIYRSKCWAEMLVRGDDLKEAY